MPIGGRKFTFQREINFWIPGDYQYVLKRIKFGEAMVDRLASFMKERTGVERASDKSTTAWRNKWIRFVLRDGSDQGIIVDIMQSIMDAHLPRMEMNRKMCSIVAKEILPKLKAFKRNSKQHGVRQLRKEFRSVQKPWAKGMKRVEKIKIIYHEACRALFEASEFLASNRVPSGHGTGVCEMTPEVREKWQTRFDEYTIEVDRCRTVYEAKLYELNFMKAEYIEGMRRTFQKCILLEKERLQCFHDCLGIFAQALDVDRNPGSRQAWHEVDLALANCTVEANVAAFSTMMGPDMPYKWPVFDEWTNRPSQSYYD